MNKIAKATEEILIKFNFYFELLFALNGAMLIAIFFSIAISDKGILNRDIHSIECISCFGFGMSTSIASITFRRISNIYSKEISTEYNSKQRKEQINNFVIFGIISFMLGVVSTILLLIGCLYYNQVFPGIG